MKAALLFVVTYPTKNKYNKENHRSSLMQHGMIKTGHKGSLAWREKAPLSLIHLPC